MIEHTKPPDYPGSQQHQTGTDVRKRAFDFNGEKYRHASAHQKEWGRKLIEELELKGSERVLDLGCGDGELTDRLASHVPRGTVLGIDSSLSMISEAQRYTRPNLAFEVWDINQIDYQEEFDVIFSNSALHWVNDHSSLYPRLLRALKAGGVARFNFPAEGNCATFDQEVRQVMALPEYATGFQGFEWPWYMPRPDEYRLLVGQFPCRELLVYGENPDRFFPDAETMIRWIDQPALVPFLPWVAPAHHAAFRAEVIKRILKIARQRDGRYVEKFRRVHVFFRK